MHCEPQTLVFLAKLMHYESQALLFPGKLLHCESQTLVFPWGIKIVHCDSQTLPPPGENITKIIRPKYFYVILGNGYGKVK